MNAHGMLVVLLSIAGCTTLPYERESAGIDECVTRIDRMGRVEVTNFMLCFSPYCQDDSIKDDYNAEDTFAIAPANAQRYRDAFQHGLGLLDALDRGPGFFDLSDWPYPHPLLDVIMTDALLVDVSKPCTVDSESYLEIETAALRGVPSSTCGGRTPNDDVIDTTQTLFINGPDRAEPHRGDGVPTPTSPASGTFPYLAAPHSSEGEGEGEGEGEPDLVRGDVLWVDFDADPVGTYSADALAAEWPGVAWNDGVDEGRVEVIGDAEVWAGHSLRVFYPSDTFGPANGGAQWKAILASPYVELYCAYRVRFGEGFDFVRSGKLPGLAGGEANTGGDPPDGTDGWSARIVWQENGAVTQYLYYPDQDGNFGDHLSWDIGGQRYFEPGQWHLVEHRIVMNTPGQRDGIVQGWFDGELALDRREIRFRDVDSLAIDAFYVSTFFGGGDASFSSSRDERVTFDEFTIGTFPLTH